MANGDPQRWALDKHLVLIENIRKKNEKAVEIPTYDLDEIELHAESSVRLCQALRKQANVRGGMLARAKAGRP